MSETRETLTARQQELSRRAAEIEGREWPEYDAAAHQRALTEARGLDLADGGERLGKAVEASGAAWKAAESAAAEREKAAAELVQIREELDAVALALAELERRERVRRAEVAEKVRADAAGKFRKHMTAALGELARWVGAAGAADPWAARTAQGLAVPILEGTAPPEGCEVSAGRWSPPARYFDQARADFQRQLSEV